MHGGMIMRRANKAGLLTHIDCHSFRATGITAYLKNSGKLEHAQAMANHSSPRTTKLYDRREEEISRDEVERIAAVEREGFDGLLLDHIAECGVGGIDLLDRSFDVDDVGGGAA